MRLILSLSLLMLCMLITGCVSPPERRDPFAGFKEATPQSPYRNLTAALLLSENTKKAIEYVDAYNKLQETWNMTSTGANGFFEEVSLILKRNFKSLIRIEKAEEARSVNADIVVLLDMYAELPTSVFSDARLEANAILLDPDGNKIDVVTGVSKNNVREVTSFSLLGNTRLPKAIDITLNQVRERFEISLRNSEKLAAFSRSRAGMLTTSAGTPPLAATSPVSDIDNPVFQPGNLVMGEDDMAVVIGVEKYQDLPTSDFSGSDALLVKSYLLSLGMKERNIALLLNERATQTSIRKTIETWLPNRTNIRSRVMIFYSGHGAPEPASGESFLVPYDGDPNYLHDTGYPLKRLYERLGSLKAAEVMVILDSCFSGAGGRSVLAKGARPLVMTAETVPLDQRLVVLSASQGSQISTSSPDKRHGVFTYYFLKALRDGKKDLAGIYQYLKPRVEDEAKMLNVQQTPNMIPSPEAVQGRFTLLR